MKNNTDISKEKKNIPPAFFIGFFKLDDNFVCETSMKGHGDEEYDDNPLTDWGEFADTEYEGYVSNAGRKVTIHIKKE